MAQMPAAEPPPGATTPAPRKRARRTPSGPRSAFIVAQVVDEQGNPTHFNKKHLKVLSVELSADKVLEMTEGGNLEHAFYVRVIVPPRQNVRPPAQPMRAAE